VHSAARPSPSPVSFPPHAVAVAKGYAQLEGDLRAAIDAAAAGVCPTCQAPCCRAHYCRETARNPWYAFVNQVAGAFPVPPDWADRRDAFGLGPQGCAIRAGRYVFCYSYNCRRLLAAVTDGDRSAFQELSDALLAANRLPGGRFLHEMRRSDDLSTDDLQEVDRSVREARSRVRRLRQRIRRVDGTSLF